MSLRVFRIDNGAAVVGTRESFDQIKLNAVSTDISDKQFKGTITAFRSVWSTSDLMSSYRLFSASDLPQQTRAKCKTKMISNIASNTNTFSSTLKISINNFADRLFRFIALSRSPLCCRELQISSAMNRGTERDSTCRRIHRAVRAAICDMCSSKNALCYLRQMAAITLSTVNATDSIARQRRISSCGTTFALRKLRTPSTLTAWKYMVNYSI